MHAQIAGDGHRTMQTVAEVRRNRTAKRIPGKEDDDENEPDEYGGRGRAVS
jgi:hypothetical protein